MLSVHRIRHLSVSALTASPIISFPPPTTFKFLGWRSLTHLIHSLFSSTLAISTIGRLKVEKNDKQINKQTFMHYGPSVVLDWGLVVRRGLGLVVVVMVMVNDDLQRVSWSSDMTIMLTMCRLLDYLLSFLCMYTTFLCSLFSDSYPSRLARSFCRFACPASSSWNGSVVPVKFYNVLLSMPDTHTLICPFQAFKMWTLFVAFLYLFSSSPSRSLPSQNGNPKPIKSNTSISASHHYTLDTVDTVSVHIFTVACLLLFFSL